MSRSRILFVDDEPNIINGLRRAFWPLREEYEAVFATSGSVALELLDEPFDVVVSDMRMPGMDGVELLRTVRARAPETIRIILSGHAEQRQVAAGRMIAHHYLSKPCPPEHLRRAVSGAVRMRLSLREAMLRSVAVPIDSLPTPPNMYGSIIAELETGSPSLEHIATLIERDRSVTEKVLQLAHSAYWIQHHAALTVRECLSLLGLDMTSKFVLAAEAFSSGESNRSVDELWAHSVYIALSARTISERSHPTGSTADADTAFIGGLLHDVGRLMLATRCGSRYDELRASGDPETVAAERHAFGATHEEIGGYLLGKWGLPAHIIEAAAYHHSPSDLLTTTGLEPHPSVIAVALACAPDVRPRGPN